MKVLPNLIVAAILFWSDLLSTTTAYEGENWYSLGNYIEEEGDQFRAGYSVVSSADGSIIAVASPWYSPNSEDSEDEPDPDEAPPNDSTVKNGKKYGRVAVYEFDTEQDEWQKLGKEIIGDNDGEQLGVSMDMSDDGQILVIGTLSDSKDSKTTQTGSVKVFKLNRITGVPIWAKYGKTIYGDAALDHFGAAVAIHGPDGNLIAVGAPGHHRSATGGIYNSVGSVSVWEYDDDNKEWNKLGDTLEGEYPNGRFGSSLGMGDDGEIIVVGAPFANDQRGRVEVYNFNMTHYNRVDTSWVGAGFGDQFGTSVSVTPQGDHVAIGAPFQTVDDKIQAGAVYVYKYVDDTWEDVGGPISTSREGVRFGYSVDLVDPGGANILDLAVGAPHSSSDGMKQNGHIYVYHYRDEKWENGDFTLGGKVEYSHQGTTVYLSSDGRQVMGGAPTEGYVSVYTLAFTPPPTSAPTSAPTEEPKSQDKGKPGSNTSPEKRKGRSGFANFILVMFIISVVCATGFLAFKGVMHYRNKRTLEAFQPTPNTDLELRNIESQEGGPNGVI
jgi:hypothetical protein